MLTAATVRLLTNFASNAISERPVTGRVRAPATGLAGDEQADKVNHGGPDQAVYAYAGEDAGFWSAEIGRELAPASCGENLTLARVDVSGARIGERWRVGGAELLVAGPRVPCFKLEARFSVRGFQRRFLRAGRPGAYLAVVSEGDLQAGDPVEIVHRPDHDVSVSLVLEALLVDRRRVPELAPARADMLPKLAGWYAELAG